MSSHAMIGVEHPDGMVHAAYVHFGDSVGRALEHHYQTWEEAEALVSLGGLSFVGAEIGEAHPFKERGERDHHGCSPVTTAYRRDRGDAPTPSNMVRWYNSREEYVERNVGNMNWVYLYTSHGWLVFV